MLLQRSSLTETQFESLLSYRKVKSGQMHFRDAAGSRSKKPVTVGSYYRTVQQARNRVRESVVTILIAMEIGLIRLEDVRRLLELVGKANTEVAEEDSERFGEILQTLLDKIVM